MSESAKSSRNTLQRSLKTYRLNQCYEDYLFIKNQVKGSLQLNNEISNPGFKHDFITCSLIPYDTFRRKNSFCNDQIEDASAKIKKISIRGFQHFNTNKQFEYDLTDDSHKYAMYRDYVTYITNGTFRQNNLASFTNMNDDKYIPSYHQYWNGLSRNNPQSSSDKKLTMQGYPLVFDLRAAGGFIKKMEANTAQDKIIVEVIYDGALDKDYQIVFGLSYIAQWNIVNPPNSNTTQIVYTNDSNSATNYNLL